MRNNILYILVAILLVFSNSLKAQNRQLDKANDLYKMERYAEAIPIYEKILEKRENIALQTKLAYCYRINNRMEEAEELYSKVVQDDRAKDISYFYYGETLIANEKYEEAKYWFNQYKKMERDDDRVDLMLRACDEVQLIQPYFRRMKIKAFPHNSEADDSSPVFFNNGIVFSSDRKQGLKLLKQKSGWTGRDYVRLYFSEATADTSLYTAPKSFSSKLNELNKNMSNPSFTADGSTVFFTRNNNELSRRNAYNLQLYQATAAGEGRWRNVEKLSFCSAQYNFMHPAVSPDGQYLFFVSNKARGQGGTDIYVSKKKENGDWGKPENLGENINTVHHEGFPFMHEDGKLYFCSKGHVGYGGFDVFVTRQDAEGNWQKPVNLGKPINSSLDDISVFLNEDKTEGMFTSSRDGGDDDIYLFTVGEGIDYKALAAHKPNVKTTSETTIPTRTLGQLPMEYEQSGNKIEIKETKEVEAAIVELKEPDTTLEITDISPREEAILEKKEEKKNSEQLTKVSTKLPVKEKQDVIKEEKITVPVAKSEKVKISVSTNPSKQIDKTTTKKKVIKPVKKAEPQEALTEPGVVMPVPKVRENLERLFYLLQSDKAAANDIFRLTNVYFQKGQFKVTPTIAKRLDEVAALLTTFPNVKIELIAHTSSLGSADKNLSLSQVRAAAAKIYLVRKGVEGDRISTKGFGEMQLVNYCQDAVICTEAEHRENQRLLVKVIGL